MNPAQASVVIAAADTARVIGQRVQRAGASGVAYADSPDHALAALEAHPAELLVIDLDSFGGATYELLAAAHERWPGLAMLVLTAEPTRERERLVVAAGGVDLIPNDSEEALSLAYERIQARARRAEAALPPPVASGRLLLGNSPAMRRVAHLMQQVAPTAATVLIRGESGTGKELVARALHAASPLSAQPFIKIDCTSLPDALLESELFGYEKGAFTGAVTRKLGRVELANGGTLFMDEVGELSLPTQAKLLRLLQDREFERLGGTRTIGVRVRILAATHRDLESMVERGQLRQDLFYRLNVVPIWLPPLRARRDDVAELALHFCRDAARRNQRAACRLEPSAVALLSAQRWPGNVRQLSNFIERLVVLSDDDHIDAAAVQAELTRPTQFTTDMGAVSAAGAGVLDAPVEPAALSPSPARGASSEHLSQVVREAERAALLRALERAGGNRSDAARVLGVSRSTFYAKLKQYGLW